jgi:hypothetical protein
MKVPAMKYGGVLERVGRADEPRPGLARLKVLAREAY